MLSKNLKISLLLILSSPVVFGQKFDSPKKGSAIGFSFDLVDFSASLLKVGKVDPGFSVMYWKGLTKKIDFSFRYNGIFSDYTKNPATEPLQITNEFEGSLHARPMNDDHLFNPFITAGIGIGNYGKKTWAPYTPLGVGLQVNMLSEGYIFLQANYRVSLSSSKLDNNMFYSLGFAQTLTRSKPAPEPIPLPVFVEPVKDRDHDGVPDSTDACPDTPGLATLNGCPDKDGDGIADKDDKCPDVPGIKKYDGCPIPDTDGDGINDEEDKCPTVAGVAKYNGCPIPDSDGDGVNDEEDKCPNLPGTVANHGCPEIKAEVRKKIEIAAKNIYFATGSAKLLAKSNKSLDEVVKILQSDQDLHLNINGFTDNTGKADKNLLLSQNRARSVYDFLVKKGVPEARIKSAGLGQDQPVAENKTAAGRAKNRRVELQLHYD